MEKYLNAVMLQEEVKIKTKYFLTQCNIDCTANNYYFNYGEIYMTKCQKTCENKNKEYMKVHDEVKITLEQNINHCMETISTDISDQKKLKDCILEYQRQAMNTLGKALEKLNHEIELDI